MKNINTFAATLATGAAVAAGALLGAGPAAAAPSSPNISGGHYAVIENRTSENLHIRLTHDSAEPQQNFGRPAASQRLVPGGVWHFHPHPRLGKPH